MTLVLWLISLFAPVPGPARAPEIKTHPAGRMRPVGPAHCHTCGGN
jgi:hypothetical protein